MHKDKDGFIENGGVFILVDDSSKAESSSHADLKLN